MQKQGSYQELIHRQQTYVKEGHTASYAFRMEQLKKLKQTILTYEGELLHSLRQDLGKSSFESYTTEIGFVLASITYTMKHLKRWMKEKRVPTPYYLFPLKSRRMYQPYGSVLIIGPYNYPFQLLMEPLCAAIAAGNCAVLCPSAQAEQTVHTIKRMLSSVFDSTYLHCVSGEIREAEALLKEHFDYIFFTGSKQVGSIVMQAAAEHLTPVTLELGGKSPVIVEKSARLARSCERIVWGKLMNAGQTCVAPDYVLVERSILSPFLEEMKLAIRRFYGEDAKRSRDYGRIISERHMERIAQLLQEDKELIVYGGSIDRKERYVEPTILLLKDGTAACMREEIFAPLLPILPYDTLSEALDIIAAQEKPLALYMFSEEKAHIRYVKEHTTSGGMCINDTISQITNPALPFGGVGSSGIGSYHGQAGFLSFSHERSVAEKSLRIPVSLLFPPYKERTEKLIRRILK